MDEAKSPAKIRAYLTQLLSRRDYSRKQLEDKLIKYGASFGEAKILIDEFIELGFFKEAAFKLSRTRTLLKKGLGSRAINSKLWAQKENMSAPELQEVYADLDLSAQKQICELIEKQLRKLAPLELDRYQRKNRIIQFLLRKGHRMDDINAELKNHKLD